MLSLPNKVGFLNRGRGVFGLVLQWVVAMGLWLIFVGSFDLAEIYAGALVAGLATIASNIVLEDKIVSFYTNPRWLAMALLLPREIAVDSFRVLRALARRMLFGTVPRSGIFRAPFDAGGDDKESATRRALAIAYGTVSPNTIILGIDRKKNEVVYHRLDAAPLSPIVERLGAPPR